MEPLLITALLAGAGWLARSRDQRKRITLLAAYLARHGIEKHMQSLLEGYLRALDEPDPERARQVWGVLHGHEQALCAQLDQLASDIRSVEPADAAVSLLPVWLPAATRIAPAFDVRDALALHARALRRAVDATSLPARDRAFQITAEILLLQHTCHWYCRSRSVASGRLLARHRTSHAQVLASVGEQTRSHYAQLLHRA